MNIPIQYNIRNLLARKTSTSLTILGIALVVWIFLLAGGIVQSLRQNVVRSGDSGNLLILHQDASEIFASTIPQPDLAVLRSYTEFAAVSPETVFGMLEASEVGSRFLLTHGLELQGLSVHPSIHIVAGRAYSPGVFELIAAKSLSDVNPRFQIGNQVKLGPNLWTVVGLYDAGGSSWDGGVIMDRQQLMANFRLDRIHAVTARLQNPDDADRVITAIASDKRMALQAERESDYYKRHTQTANSIQAMGFLISIIIAIGATFGAVNTLYAAVAARGREIGTLRALGFSRGALLSSFLLEGIFLSGAGGILGCIFGLLSTGLVNFSLPEQAVGSLSVHPVIGFPLLLGAFLFSLLMGAVGGIFPALQAARMEIMQALRKV